MGGVGRENSICCSAFCSVALREHLDIAVRSALRLAESALAGRSRGTVCQDCSRTQSLLDSILANFSDLADLVEGDFHTG